MAIKGSLKEASLADVCQLLALGGKTGSLSITDRSNFGQIFFDRGRVTYAQIVNRRDRLGDLLVRDGQLTHEQLEQVIDEQARRPEARLGQLLVEHGLITGDVLERYIRRQIEEAVYHLFTWSRGTFFFEADKRPEDADILVSINPENLLLEGARRVDEWSLIENKIPSLDLIFQLDREHFDASEVELTEEQRRIVPLLDGSRSVQEIADETGLVEFEAGKALFGLIQAGFAHQVGRRGAQPSGRVREADIDEFRNLGVAFYRSGMYDDAAREFERVLEVRGDDHAALFHLALIAIRRGEHREALGQMRKLVERFGPRAEPFGAIAYALLRLGRVADARLALGQAQSLGGDAARLALLRAAIELEAGDVDAAEAALREHAARLDGAAAGAAFHHMSGLAAALGGELERARERVREGLEAWPESAPLLLLGAVIAERQGDLDEADRLARRALEEAPALPQVHKNLGDIAYRRGLHDDALEHYRRAVELDPRLGDDVYTKLGNIHYKRLEREEAVRAWRSALALNPENRVVERNLEVASHAQG